MKQLEAVWSYLREFNTVSVILRIVLSMIAGGVIGIERGRHGSAAGFRTHIYVCLGGAMTSLCGLFVTQTCGLSGDVFRISAQVISGIGFLGAGIILVRNNSVAGLTTAAGMWVTATIGIAFGFGFYLGGLLAAVICVVNAALLTRVEHKRMRSIRFYVEINDLQKLQSALAQLETAFGGKALIETVPARSGIAGSIGFVVSTTHQVGPTVREAVNRIDGVSFILPG